MNAIKKNKEVISLFSLLFVYSCLRLLADLPSFTLILNVILVAYYAYIAIKIDAGLIYFISLLFSFSSIVFWNKIKVMCYLVYIIFNSFMLGEYHAMLKQERIKLP